MLRLRALAAEEAGGVERLARPRSAGARLVERAGVIALARGGKGAPAIARALGVSEKRARQGVRRFNAAGPGGLADAPRSGRPATCRPAAAGEIGAASLTTPETLGLPFACWALGRRAA